MRILVCGSRKWPESGPLAGKILDVLDAFAAIHGNLTIIEGGARGADTVASMWAEENAADSHLQFPALWDLHGRRAGYLRNTQMLEEGSPDLVLAFRLQGHSPGTDMMIHIAEKAGIETVVIQP